MLDTEQTGVALGLTRRASAPLGPLQSTLRSIDWSAYAYVAPAGIVLLVFDLFPIAFGFWISLWRWGVGPEAFVGFQNYLAIFENGIVTRDFLGRPALGTIGQSFLVTLYYVVGTVPLSILLSFGFALLLFRVRVLRDFLRAVYFLPYVTSVVAAGMVFFWIFDPQIGVANSILHALGLPAQTWLQDPTPALAKFLEWGGQTWVEGIPTVLTGPSVALVIVVVFSVWNSLGFDITVYLAGLSAIPAELEDAAMVDGASSWQRMRHIVLPLVSPTTSFLIITSTIRSFQAFTPIFTLTEGGAAGSGLGAAGGPLGTTRVLTVQIFYDFYEQPNMVGYASSTLKS